MTIQSAAATGIVRILQPELIAVGKAGVSIAGKAGPAITRATIEATADLISRTTPVARKAISTITDLFINLLKRTAAHPEILAGRVLPALKYIESTNSYKAGKCLHDLIGTVTRVSAIPAAVIAVGLGIASYAGVLPAGGVGGLLGLGSLTGGAAATEVGTLTAGAAATEVGATVIPPESSILSHLLFTQGIIAHPSIIGLGILGTSCYLHNLQSMRISAQEERHATELAALKSLHNSSHLELLKVLSPRSRGQSGESEEPNKRNGTDLSVASTASATNPTSPLTEREAARVPPLDLQRVITRRSSV